MKRAAIAFKHIGIGQCFTCELQVWTKLNEQEASSDTCRATFPPDHPVTQGTTVPSPRKPQTSR
jgi:hypothetical protein